MSASLSLPSTHPLPRGPLVVLACWTALSFLFAISGLLTQERLLAVPLAIAGGVTAVLLAARFSAAARAFVDTVELKWFLALHCLRLPIGAAFLFELSRGRLDPLFARGAGIGDIAVGVLALALLLIPALRSPRTLFAFNLIGLIDILGAMVSAQRVLFFSDDPARMASFMDAPYPMIPSLVVPLVLSTHLLMFGRLKRERAAASAGA
jgi:hypothetical protein